MKYPTFAEPEQLHQESDEILSAKVAALLRAMTDEEKMSLCHGSPNPPGGQVGNAGYLPGIPRLGVPEIRMYDGPAGVTSVYETTGLPVEEALASSWSPDLAYQYGKVEGSENFAISGNTQLGSQFDVVRTPHFSRNRDMMGEDPYLVSRLAVAETKGIQDQHCVTTVKHFAMACMMSGMGDAIDQQVDEQTFHELYLPAFEAAAKEGRAGAFMCSYNKFNGTYASANEYAQKTVLRDMWNYKGYIMSDWGANHALTVGKGLDVEMPNGAYNSDERILKGIAKGRITWDDVNTAAGHVLYGMGMAGYLSLVQLDERGNVIAEDARAEPIHIKDRYAEAVTAGLLRSNAEVCLDVARQGIVLLKNKDRALPLTDADYTTGSVALIGLGATHLLAGSGGERSYGQISRMQSPAEALVSLTGTHANIIAETAIDYLGATIPSKYLYQDKACTANGLIRTWGVSDSDSQLPNPFAAMPNAGGAGQEFKGVATAEGDDDDDVIPFGPGSTWSNDYAYDVPGHETGSFCCTDEVLEFTCGTTDGTINKSYKNSSNGTAFTKGQAYTWNGYLTVPEDGEYDLILQSIGGNAIFKFAPDGSSFVTVGSTSLRESAQWPWSSLICSPEGMDVSGQTFYLKKGVAYPLRIMANATITHKDLQIRISWITPQQRAADYQAALAAAQKANKVLLFISEAYGHGGSGFMMGDMDLEIPEKQWQLICDVKSAMKPEAKLILVHNNGLIYAYGKTEPLADAIVNVWNPGQEGGRAIAEVLLGIHNPSGKLPQSIPANAADTPISDTEEHHMKRSQGYTGKDGKRYVDHSEGIFTGYRWHDKSGVKALFPFGHGLSYTSFGYRDILIEENETNLAVTFTVENTGDVSGTEIAQVYIGAGTVPSGIQMAEKKLCGFVRLQDMQPHESRTVTVTIPEQSLCYWDPNAPLCTREDGTKDKWVRANGVRTIFVGASSEDIRLSVDARIV